jgi:hypothetical protein
MPNFAAQLSADLPGSASAMQRIENSSHDFAKKDSGAPAHR